MRLETVERLLALNNQFYQTFGKEFASTRQRLQQGVKRVLETLQGQESILDLGCGNGELACWLSQRKHHGTYTGLDSSTAMLAAARAACRSQGVIFLDANLGIPGWEQSVRATVFPPFDLVCAFAVLHHIPGENVRRNIIRKVHAMLSSKGRFIHSEWQFLNSEKLKTRIQPWSETGVDEDDLDPGDYLLDWRSGGRGLRYVHHFNEDELESLARTNGFCVLETFLSDGENGRLGLYQVWEKT